MPFADFPFLRYLFFFVLGILLYPFMADIPKWIVDSVLLLLFLIYVVLLLAKPHKISGLMKSMVFPSLAYSQLVLMGIQFSFYRDVMQSGDHLTHHQEEIRGYLAVVIGQDEIKPNSIANRVMVKKVYSKEAFKALQGEVIIYRRDSVSWLPGDLVWIEGSPQNIKSPNNPFEFDYRKFMSRQQVMHQHFVGERFQKIAWINEFPIEYFFVRLRTQVLDQIDGHFKDFQANQIAKALLLGQKKSLDKELSEAYAAAGAMHVLAVSGLHVGIIYGFFFLWIKPYRLSVRKRIFYLSGIILLIWCYALLTGMSPSVMRAATMFSLMGLAQMKSRSPSIFNAIALSALMLLVFDPQLIYSVGFQLSYMALSGILLIQPILVRMWIPENRILEYIWQISTVGLAAQMATFPISSFYFHIFPVYFLLSNLIAIPGAFLIMSFGIPYMILGQVNVLGEWLSKLTEIIIQLVNKGIITIQTLPYSRLSEIYLDPFDVLLYFFLLGLLLLMVHQPSKKLLWMMVAFMFFGGIYRIIDRIAYLDREELLVYQLDKGWAIDYFYQGNLFVYDQAEENELTYKVKPNRERQSSDGFFPLVPFQVEDRVEFLLPNGYTLITGEEQVSLENEGPDLGVFELDSGKWRKIQSNGPLKADEKALKIVFQ